MEESSKNIIVTLVIALAAVYAVGTVGSYAYVKNKRNGPLPVVSDAYAMKCKNVIARYQNMVWCRSIEQYHREMSETLQSYKTEESLYNHLETKLPIGSSQTYVEKVLIDRFHAEITESSKSGKGLVSVTYSSKLGDDVTEQRDIMAVFDGNNLELLRFYVQIPESSSVADWYPESDNSLNVHEE